MDDMKKIVLTIVAVSFVTGFIIGSSSVILVLNYL